jgi:flagellar hook assembly protein FlgD
MRTLCNSCSRRPALSSLRSRPLMVVGAPVVIALCLALGVPDVDAATFNPRPVSTDPYIFRMDRAVANDKIHRDLFCMPYDVVKYGRGTIEAGHIVWDDVYYFAADPCWDRVIYMKTGTDGYAKCYGGHGECGGGVNALDRPTSIDIASNEQLFVADTNNNRIVVLQFSPGSDALTFVKELKIEDPDTPLKEPFAVSWNHAGTPFDFTDDYVWVADTGNHRLVKFDVESGVVLAVCETFEDPDTGAMETLNYPQGIACLDQYGNDHENQSHCPTRIYVADTGNRRILRLMETCEGEVILDNYAGWGYALDHGSAPATIATDANMICIDADEEKCLYVPDENNSIVHKLSYAASKGCPMTPIKSYGEEGIGDVPGQFMHPRATSIMRGRVVGPAPDHVISWMGIDCATTAEDWTAETGGLRHDIGIEAEVRNIDVIPTYNLAEFQCLNTARGFATIEILDADSNLVRTLVDDALLGPNAWQFEWDGRDDSQPPMYLPQGDYILRVSAEEYMYEDDREPEAPVAEKMFTFPDPIPSVEVLSPNGGESWAIGSTEEISWDIPGFGPTGCMRVDVYWDGGMSSKQIGETSFPPDTRSIEWTVDLPDSSSECFVRVRAYYEGSGFKEDISDTYFSVCRYGVPFAGTSSVLDQPPAQGYICPAGHEGDLIEMSATLRDCLGNAIDSVPAEDVAAVVREDTAGTAIVCTGTTFNANWDSDENGWTNISIPKVGGCGDLTFDVYALGILMGRQTIHVRSPDLNGDCVVDAEDDALFFEHFVVQNLCADFNGDGLVDASDQTILYQHYASDGSKYHFSIDPAYSSATVTPSDPTCIVLCPKGDMDVFSTTVEARNARNEVFLYSAIPADSIWAQIPGADGIGFRLVCRDDPEVATADGPTSEPENTTITVNSAGGSCWSYYEYPPGDWPITVHIGGQQVGEWTGFPKSPDIDASGVVNGTDFSLWSEDYFWCSLYTPPECRERYSRSDFDCNDTVDEADFDIMNPHYKHRCGASSQMLAEGQSEPASWTDRDAEGIRSHLPNYVLDRFLAKELHPELRTLLMHVKGMEEPDSLAVMRGETRAAAIDLLPQVTSLAQSTPNPFMGKAVIGYQVAPPGGRVRITIFDVAGRRVRTLVDRETPPSFYKVPWDGRDDDGRKLASGVYFYQMKAPGFTSHRRMVMIR